MRAVRSPRRRRQAAVEEVAALLRNAADGTGAAATTAGPRRQRGGLATPPQVGGAAGGLMPRRRSSPAVKRRLDADYPRPTRRGAANVPRGWPSRRAQLARRHTEPPSTTCAAPPPSLEVAAAPHNRRARAQAAGLSPRDRPPLGARPAAAARSTAMQTTLAQRGAGRPTCRDAGLFRMRTMEWALRRLDALCGVAGQAWRHWRTAETIISLPPLSTGEST